MSRCAAEGCRNDALGHYQHCYPHERAAQIDEFCDALIALPFLISGLGLLLVGAALLGRWLS